MVSLKKICFLLLPLLSIGCGEDKANNTSTSTEKETVSNSASPVFKKIDPSQSNLVFENTITENLETLHNLFSFDYFYNGAGVGIEDLNNDGLQDIFFCGNQVTNKLFLNKGNLQFEDISEKANINQGKNWANGITFVDINNDGFKDIYVSQGGPNTRFNRKNLLFINNGDLTFDEKAEAYGLADLGISTQSVFFDFDKDGDLDCLVMNENELYGLDPISLYKMIGNDREKVYFNSSHLYQNNQGTFVDITEKAGLQRPFFGLGLCVSDINNDGWLDIYMASDYFIPDALFTNNGDGTFSDTIKEATQHTSFFGMGLDIADINSDGLQDIFVLDMSSSDHVRSKTLMASMSTGRFDYLVNKADFHYQYMFNSLHLNLGNEKFNNVSQLTNTANTDWSWSVLLSDYDHDEDADIFITNGYRRYALDNDLQNKVFQARKRYGSNIPLEVKKQLYAAMPSEKLPNILFRNDAALEFNEKAQSWGLDDFSFSNGAAQADLDNDGDLDLVVNNIDENAFLYQNTTTEQQLGNFLTIKPMGSHSESFAKVKLSYNGKSQFQELKRVRGYMSAQESSLHFGLGNTAVLDTVTVIWPSGKTEQKYQVAANTILTFEENNAIDPKNTSSPAGPYLFNAITSNALGIDYRHKENYFDDFDTEILLPYKQSNLGPFITKADVNGDGKEDVFLGGASGQSAALYVQTENGFKLTDNPVFEADKRFEDMEAVFFDFDNDTDMDLFLVSGGNEFEEHSSYYTDRMYLNDGKGTFSRFESDVLSAYPKSGKSVTVLDFDNDGDSDLLIGNRIIPKNYPNAPASTLYENVGGTLRDVTADKAPGLQNFGIINDIIATDFDNDGWVDFMAVGEWTPVGAFKNHKGTFTRLTASETPLNDKGWWFSIAETDVNNDGLKDYIVGNAGLNLKFTASREKPFKIFANDFDGNGVNDIVLSKKYNGEYVPVRGKECSSQQMPFIKEKFGSYTDFANATLTDIYGEKLSESYRNEVTTFESILLINQGEGIFKKQNLPIYAQQFPLLKTIVTDIDNDGFDDCILAGNIYETEVETPRLDAKSGVVLLSNTKDGYTALPYTKTGLYLSGNVKDLELVETSQGRVLLSTTNNDRLNAYKIVPN